MRRATRALGIALATNSISTTQAFGTVSSCRKPPEVAMQPVCVTTVARGAAFPRQTQSRLSLRQAAGVVPVSFRNVRPKCTPSAKPVASATRSSESFVVSNRLWAR